MTAGWEPYRPPRPTAGFTQVRPRPPRPPRRAVPKPHAPKPPVRRQVLDPFAPQSEDQSRARAAALMQSQLGPLMAQIQQAIEARSRSGQQAIQGYTGELGHLWQGVPAATGKAYDTARASQSGINEALANRLGSFGKDLGSEIQGKIGYAPAAVQQQVAGGAQQTAQGVANANFAKGSAGIEALNAQGAAAQAYGAALPGIAGLTGLQSSKQLQGQLNSELARQLGDARSQSQTSLASLYERERDRELQKAVASQSGLINKDKLNADRTYKQQTLRYKQAKDRNDRSVKLKNLGISQQRVTEYARHNGISEGQAGRRLIQQGRNARTSAAARAQSQRETHRHNVKTESKKGKGSKAPWAP